MTERTRNEQHEEAVPAPRDAAPGSDAADAGREVYGDGVDVGSGENTAGGSYGDTGGFGGYGTPSSVPSTIQPGRSGDGDDDEDGSDGTAPPMPASSGKT